jgi:hypothetical protein
MVVNFKDMSLSPQRHVKDVVVELAPYNGFSVEYIRVISIFRKISPAASDGFGTRADFTSMLSTSFLFRSLSASIRCGAPRCSITAFGFIMRGGPSSTDVGCHCGYCDIFTLSFCSSQTMNAHVSA